MRRRHNNSVCVCARAQLCVSRYVCADVYKQVDVRRCALTDVCAGVCAQMCACMCVCRCVRTGVYAQMCVYICVHRCVHMCLQVLCRCVCVQMCVHIVCMYMCVQIGVQMCAHTCRGQRSRSAVSLNHSSPYFGGYVFLSLKLTY